MAGRVAGERGSLKYLLFGCLISWKQPGLLIAYPIGLQGVGVDSRTLVAECWIDFSTAFKTSRSSLGLDIAHAGDDALAKSVQSLMVNKLPQGRICSVFRL